MKSKYCANNVMLKRTDVNIHVLRFINLMKVYVQYAKTAENKMRERKLPDDRKNELLTEAVELSKEIGYSHITRDGVAERAGVSYGLVTRYFQSMDNLRRLVLKEAIRTEVLEIIAQGLVRKDPLTKRLPPQLKEKVLLYLSK